MKGAADINPGFRFDLGGPAEPAQAPWDFGGALAQARAADPLATSIDEKIQRQRALGGLGRQLDKRRGKRAAQSSEEEEDAPAAGSDSDDEGPPDDDSDDEQLDAGSDSEDRPLPGEEDDESEEESEPPLSDDEEGLEEPDGGSSDGEPPPAKVQQPAASVRKRGRQPAQPAADEESEEDGEAGFSEEDEEGADGPAPKQQQHQHQRAAKRGKGADSKPAFFDPTPKGTKFSAKSFADLNLSRPLVKACQALGYTHPTPIQAACIPLALTGRDICGSAVTGSGKTAAFALPLLERLLHRSRRVAATYVLVLAPVRELAVQVHSMVQRLAQFTDVRAALVVGGLSLGAQAAALRDAPEVVVATPGRMIDHLRNSVAVGLESLQALVLDEADRLLEMGFAGEVQELVRMAPPNRQTLLFSATMTEEVRQLAALSLRHPVRLAADAAAAAPARLAQEVVRLKGAQATRKEAALLALCSRSLSAGRAIVFARTKARAHRLKLLFGLAGLPAAAELHGDMTQAARLESLERFRKGEVAFLLATDVAARGLDILGVRTVVNYDAPAELSSYLHRVGRTARAGAGGRAVTLAEDGDRPLLKEVVKRTGAALQQRSLPAGSVSSWQATIEGLEEAVASVIAEEREERALRKAEMEAQKATNLIEHEAEIFARPARTWFQSEKAKREAAAAGAPAGPTAKQKKVMDKNERKREMKREAQANQAAKKKGQHKLTEETKAETHAIRAAKATERQLRLQGVAGAKAGKLAAKSLAPKPSGRGKKRSGAGGPASGREGEGGLFSGDGLPGSRSGGGGGSAKVYSGGASSQKVKAPGSAAGLSKSALGRVKRGGKGKHMFKSKARHKRR